MLLACGWLSFRAQFTSQGCLASRTARLANHTSASVITRYFGLDGSFSGRKWYVLGDLHGQGDSLCSLAGQGSIGCRWTKHYKMNHQSFSTSRLYRSIEVRRWGRSWPWHKPFIFFFFFQRFNSAHHDTKCRGVYTFLNRNRAA